jgi:hypothetical protein
MNIFDPRSKVIIASIIGNVSRVGMNFFLYGTRRR